MKLDDLTGKTFGRLTVLSRAETSRTGQTRWNCRCSCGNTTVSHSTNLKSGTAHSCGCFTSERVTKMNYRHGGRYTPEYAALENAISRCSNPRHQAWKNYGGRGIGVCAEWVRSFSSFLDHIGLRPSEDHELDRKDNSRGYEPGNVRWTTRSTQAKNRRERVRRADGTYTGVTRSP